MEVNIHIYNCRVWCTRIHDSLCSFIFYTCSIYCKFIPNMNLWVWEFCTTCRNKHCSYYVLSFKLGFAFHDFVASKLTFVTKSYDQILFEQDWPCQVILPWMILCICYAATHCNIFAPNGIVWFLNFKVLIGIICTFCFLQVSELLSHW